jgi:S-adenosylmethionine/arginine decarboxylase-like enzyme
LENRHLELKAWGLSAIIDLFGCDSKKVRDIDYLKNFSYALCKEIDMVPYGKPNVKRFGAGSLEGNSMLQFIQTSSITVHCDEEYNRVFVDIFSCKSFNAEKAEFFCKEYFEAKESLMVIHDRG